jgi:hypothetical protein
MERLKLITINDEVDKNPRSPEKMILVEDFGLNIMDPRFEG